MLKDPQGTESSTQPERIVVLRALQLGDLLCTVPAFRALRAEFPRAHIALAGLPWAASFVERFGRYVDEFIEFPGADGLPEQPARHEQLPGFLRQMQQRHFNVALQMHGSGYVVNDLIRLFRADVTAGFYPPSSVCPNPELFYPYPEQAPEVLRHLRLLEFLGIPLQGDELEFHMTQADFEVLEAAEGSQLLRRAPYICMHPGARFPSRRWAPERFAAVADALCDRGFRIVLTGSAEETDLAMAVARQMQTLPLILAGRTTLGALAALLQDARLLISNDTGLSHLAAALRVPSVIIANGSNAQRWAPLNGRIHRVLAHSVACRPCEHVVCPVDGHPCAEGVSPEQVLREAETLLHLPPSRPAQAPDALVAPDGQPTHAAAFANSDMARAWQLPAVPGAHPA